MGTIQRTAEGAFALSESTVKTESLGRGRDEARRNTELLGEFVALTIIIYSIPHQFSLSSYDFYHKERTKIFWDDFKVLFFFFFHLSARKELCQCKYILFFFFVKGERNVPFK